MSTALWILFFLPTKSSCFLANNFRPTLGRMKASQGGLTLLLLISACATAQTSRSESPPARITLREAHLPAAMRDQIASIIVQKIRAEDSDPQLEVNVLDFFTEFPKLAQDGRRTISVQSASPFVGAHESELWIFQLLGRHALQMLNNEDATGYSPYKSAYHNGMRDYQVTAGSGNQWGTVVYQFDGNQYQRAFCQTSVMDGHNNLRLVHQGKCRQP
jgi:hypothetical protein